MTKSRLWLVATGEKLVPIAAKHGAHTRHRGQARIVFARFNAPQIPRTHTGVFGQFFLSQIPPRPQTRHVPAKTLSE